MRNRKYYNRDPRELVGKFGKCARCGCSMAGVDGYYWPSSRKIYCRACGESDWLAFLSAAADEAGCPFAC